MDYKDAFDWVDNCTCHDPDILDEIKQLLSSMSEARQPRRTVTLHAVKRAINLTWDSNWSDSRTKADEVALTVARLAELGVKVEE